MDAVKFIRVALFLVSIGGALAQAQPNQATAPVQNNARLKNDAFRSQHQAEHDAIDANYVS